MADIDQSRFPLIAVLSQAHEARPDEYPDPQTLIAMSDDDLRGYAVGLLYWLEVEPRSDSVASLLRRDLRRILHDTPFKDRPR